MSTKHFKKVRSSILWAPLFLFVNIGLVRADADSPIDVVKLGEQAWYEAADKAVAREIISPRNSSVESMSIAEIKVPVGVEVVPHHHIMEEVYHVISGTGLMMVEDSYEQLVGGDTVLIKPHQWHNIKNNGDEELLLVVTCVPTWAPELLQFERR